jgi:hypothetical protein
VAQEVLQPGLMNFAVMGNSGALLFKVMDCSDVRKVAAGISELLSTTGAEIMGGEAQASGFGGWTVDNTRTNMAALSRLEVSRPTWICVGCIAHGLSLAITDFAGQMKSTKGRGSQTFGCQWLADTNHAANANANYVQDSGSARALLHKQQQEIYGARRSIDVSIPTRFVTNLFVRKVFYQRTADTPKNWIEMPHGQAETYYSTACSSTGTSRPANYRRPTTLLVMQDIHRSQAALKQAVSNPAWQRLGGKAEGARRDPRLHVLVPAAIGISFLQLFSDFIHQIEADRPALGRYQGLQQLD